MELFAALAPFIFKMGTTLGAGSSTFALAFFIKALSDGVIDQSERGLMHVVYAALRISMVLIAVGLVGLLWTREELPLAAYFMLWTLLSIITINGILMTRRLMPMRLGPVIAGASWYSIFFVSESFVDPSTSYGMFWIYYILFAIVFFVAFEILKSKFIAPIPPKP
ncbi:MAG: hypothetical protein AAB421_04945 [Patescibacteria group bacterium]